MTSDDGDSNPVHLFDFLFFKRVAVLMKKQQGVNCYEKQLNTTLCPFCLTGVAEQFALAEAAMNVWSMNDEQPSTSFQGLKNIQKGCICLYVCMNVFMCIFKNFPQTYILLHALFVSSSSSSEENKEIHSIPSFK